MHSIETEFIKNFIKPHRQERWLACLASTNKRSAFLDCLNHCRDFEDQHVRIIRSASQLEEALHRVGGEDECYILSSDPKLDGYWVKLDTAMERVQGDGYIVGCSHTISLSRPLMERLPCTSQWLVIWGM